MILGLGIDIIEIDRIKASVERFGDRFLKKVFTQKEIDYCMTKREHIYGSLASRFAAKESFYKAFHHISSFSWRDIEVSNNAFGKPEIHFSPEFKLKIKNEIAKTLHIHLSLSDSKEYSVAVCLIESQP